jgi:hypothetical protein
MDPRPDCGKAAADGARAVAPSLLRERGRGAGLVGVARWPTSAIAALAEGLQSLRHAAEKA